MADNSVFITGAADGAFEKAFSGLPDWASEATLLSIAKNLSRSMPIQTQALRDIVRELKGRSGSGSGGSGKSGAASSESELSKLTKELIASNKALEKKKKADKEQEQWDKNNLLGVKKLTNKWQVAAAALDVLKTAGNKVLEVDKQYIKTYDDLYKSGVNVLAGQNNTASGMKALNNIVTLTGVRLEVLQLAMQKYSTAVNAVGITKFSKTVGLADKNMRALGFAPQEAAEMLGAYIDMQSNFADMRRKTDSELSSGVQAFTRQLVKTSLVFGISQEKVLANAEALSKTKEAFVSTAVLGKTVTENTTNSLMGLPEELSKEIQKSMVMRAQGTELAGPNMLRDLATSASAAYGPMVQLVDSLRAGTATQEEIRARLEAIKNSPAFNAQAGQSYFGETLNVEGSQSAGKLLQQIEQITNTTSLATKAQIDAAIAQKALHADLAAEREKNAAIPEAAFYPMNSQIKATTDGLRLLNDAIYGIINHTNAEARSMVGAGTIVAGFAAAIILPLYGKFKNLSSMFDTVRGVPSAGGASAASKAGIDAAEKGGAKTVGKDAAKWGAKGIGKLGGKALGKLIPGIGLAFGVYDAIERASKGDYLGASMAGASGIASLFPGVGTAIAAGLDVANIARDVTGSSPQSTINSPSSTKPTTPNGDSGSSANSPTDPTGPGTEKAASKGDINSMLAFQNALTQQLVEQTTKLISINGDILRATKMQA